MRGFLWENGKITVTDLGSLGGDCFDPHAINAKGEIVGWAQTGTQKTHAFLWRHGALTDLGALGGDWSVAWDINDRGQIVGHVAWLPYRTEGFLWEDGRVTRLTSPKGEDTVAFAINDRGQAVGSAGEDSNSVAMLWEKGVGTRLNDLIYAAPGWNITLASDINNRGWIAAAGERNRETHAVLLIPDTDWWALFY